MTLLVVDGMDRCGKDTVVRGLVRGRKTTKPLHIIHNIAPPVALKGGDARRYQLECYLSQLQMIDEMDAHDFILNRSWLSEEVYGAIYRGQPTRLPAEFMHDAAAILGRHRHLLLVVTDMPDRVLERTDGDSTFDKTGDRLAGARRERDLFVEAADRASDEYGIGTIQRDGVHPDKVLEEVARVLGW